MLDVSSQGGIFPYSNLIRQDINEVSIVHKTCVDDEFTIVIKVGIWNNCSERLQTYNLTLSGQITYLISFPNPQYKLGISIVITAKGATLRTTT